MTNTDTLARVADTPPAVTDWGRIAWLVGAEEMPGAEQTFGVVTILPGKRNPLHAHPNCEELLYVISGSCDHLLEDAIIPMQAGDVIRIPRGVKHWAMCTSEEPMVAVISFSSPHRRVENYDSGGIA